MAWKKSKDGVKAKADSQPGPAVRDGRRPWLCEVSWEACHQVGGIYTVIRSKAPTITRRWGDRYLLLGPYDAATSPMEFEESPAAAPIAQAVNALQAEGLVVRHGHWLVTGQPAAVLMELESARGKLAEIKYLIWEHHRISLPERDDLLDSVVLFGWMVERFFRALTSSPELDGPVIGHFHEWLAGTAIPELRRADVPLTTVFTTHATSLGRYMAMNDGGFYDHVRGADWQGQARRFGIEAQVRLERAAAHGAHVLTTVSDLTGEECEFLLGRKADVLLPNGLNIERFVAVHEFQNLHVQYKERITQFVMGHFFPSGPFNIDRTLYFFTSGRYEYRNKGFDLTIDALAELNARMRASGDDRTVVFFLIAPRPFRSIDARVLQSQAQMEEMRRTCEACGEQMAERLFQATAAGQEPALDDLVDDFWRMRLLRLRHVWQARRSPAVVTHDLVDPGSDDVLNYLRRRGLTNAPTDPVKVVYHPDFLSSSTPLLGLEYDQFVRGCHLGVFPSYYEPWGYTPQECLARAVPAVTSDLSGFGSYLQANIPDHAASGLFMVHRRGRPYEASVHELAELMWNYTQLGRRRRIDLRNRVESISGHFHWGLLISHYDRAYDLACSRTGLGGLLLPPEPSVPG